MDFFSGTGKKKPRQPQTDLGDPNLGGRCGVGCLPLFYDSGLDVVSQIYGGTSDIAAVLGSC